MKILIEEFSLRSMGYSLTCKIGILLFIYSNHP